MMATTLSFGGFGGINLAADGFGSPDDPIVLLVPTIGQTREVWHGAATALAAAGRHAICLDLRGHGGSDRAPDGRYDLEAYALDLRAVLTQLSSRAQIVGAGAGGLAALMAIGEDGAGLASALVLVGVTLWVDRAIAARIVEAMARRTELFDSEAEALAAIAAVHPGEPQPAATARLLRAFDRDAQGRYRLRVDPNAFGSIDLPAQSARLEKAAAGAALPVALIRGTDNETVSIEATQKLQALMPDAQIMEIEGGGHHVATDREELFNATLLDFLERKAPRAPIVYHGGADPRVLRDALGCFGTGVTVVTTVDADGNPVGLTANSFTSVSLDPPLILFCLAGTSGSLETFRNAGQFAINVLHIGQQPASNRFARREAQRFEGIAWEYRGEGGSPILRDSLASFDCTTHAVHEGGDHMIFVGRVRQAFYEPHRDPLIYFRGKYRRLHFA